MLLARGSELMKNMNSSDTTTRGVAYIHDVACEIVNVQT
jgi:hypothetical protein